MFRKFCKHFVESGNNWRKRFPHLNVWRCGVAEAGARADAALGARPNLGVRDGRARAVDRGGQLPSAGGDAHPSAVPRVDQAGLPH